MGVCRFVVQFCLEFIVVEFKEGVKEVDVGWGGFEGEFDRGGAVCSCRLGILRGCVGSGTKQIGCHLCTVPMSLEEYRYEGMLFFCSNEPMNIFAYDGATGVPIAVPLVWR